MNSQNKADTEKVLLFDYFGLEIFLLPTDRTPVHIYARSGDTMSCAELYFEKGIFKGADFHTVPDAGPLDESDRKRFSAILEDHLSEVVRAWIDHYIFQRAISAEQLIKRIEV